MTPGPKPAPRHLRLLTNNPGHRPIEDELELSATEPDMPAHLDARAQQEWKRITPELMKARLLATVDRAALGLYCQAYSRWQFAEERISAHALEDVAGAGLIKKAANGFDQLTQWLVISNKAQEQLHRYLQEFGLTPSTRARVAALARQGSLFENDPMEGVLRAGQSARRAG